MAYRWLTEAHRQCHQTSPPSQARVGNPGEISRAQRPRAFSPCEIRARLTPCLACPPPDSDSDDVCGHRFDSATANASASADGVQRAECRVQGTRHNVPSSPAAECRLFHGRGQAFCSPAGLLIGDSTSSCLFPRASANGYLPAVPRCLQIACLCPSCQACSQRPFTHGQRSPFGRPSPLRRPRLAAARCCFLLFVAAPALRSLHTDRLPLLFFFLSQLTRPRDKRQLSTDGSQSKSLISHPFSNFCQSSCAVRHHHHLPLPHGPPSINISGRGTDKQILCAPTRPTDLAWNTTTSSKGTTMLSGSFLYVLRSPPSRRVLFAVARPPCVFIYAQPRCRAIPSSVSGEKPGLSTMTGAK